MSISETCSLLFENDKHYNEQNKKLKHISVFILNECGSLAIFRSVSLYVAPVVYVTQVSDFVRGILSQH